MNLETALTGLGLVVCCLAALIWRSAMTWVDKFLVLLVSLLLAIFGVVILMVLTLVWVLIFGYPAHAAEPLKLEARARPSELAVLIDFESHPDNHNVQIAVTALDGIPPEWANATVYHQYILDDPEPDADGREKFVDIWPMLEGRYDIEGTLFRGEDRFVVTIKEILITKKLEVKFQ